MGVPDRIERIVVDGDGPYYRELEERLNQTQFEVWFDHILPRPELTGIVRQSRRGGQHVTTEEFAARISAHVMAKFDERHGLGAATGPSA